MSKKSPCPKVSAATISELTFDDKNPNKHTERGQQLLESSLQKYGAGRSILLDRNNKIISGNQTAENAGQIGLDDLIVVETDGTKLVAVKRTDLDLDRDPKARELAVADNRVAEMDLEWDPVVLAELSKGDEVDLSGMFTEAELHHILESAVVDSGSDRVTGTIEVKLTCPKCGHTFTKGKYETKGKKKKNR